MAELRGVQPKAVALCFPAQLISEVQLFRGPLLRPNKETTVGQSGPFPNGGQFEALGKPARTRPLRAKPSAPSGRLRR